MKKIKSVRLPNHIRPERYKLTIKPDLKGFVFSGDEVIILYIDKPVKEITLHTKELKIAGAELRAGSVKWKPVRIKYDDKAETVTFVFSQIIPKGKGELYLSFSGNITEQMRGFYRSRYMHKGKERYIATTQFEATDARRAFPCFDEPSHKAIFDVTLLVPKSLAAISNTIESSVSEHESGYKIIKFSPTPIMSTYLLAFIIGDFEFIEGKTKNGVLTRVFTLKGKKHQGEFALNTAIKALDFFEEYFDIPYPLPVLDLIAIPDFSSAAMENWGAVTYRESALLVDPKLTSATTRQWVAIVIAHELAHQWFGNLVTMEWWTDLWLNEGFASYMEYVAVDALFPQWDMWTQYVGGRFDTALHLDSLKNSHPIEIEVHHPDEIGEIFDMISYAKGSGVIRMLAEFVGPELFKKGLRHYLKKHSYKNTVTDDLWESLEIVSKKPVRKIMDAWTMKTGYPVVNARLIQKKGKKMLELKQERFFSSEISKNQVRDKTIWNIPVIIRLGNKGKSLITSLSKQKITVPIPSDTSWIKVNTGEVGFFRTFYQPELLALLNAPIRTKILSAPDRLGVIRDAFAAAKLGFAPTVQALILLREYVDEDDLTVWGNIVDNLQGVDAILFGRAEYLLFQQFKKNIYSSIGRKLGWKISSNEPEVRSILRTLILQELGLAGDGETIKYAQKLFAENKQITSDLRGVVYNLVARNGTEREHQRLLQMYENAQLQEEKDRIGKALGKFRQPALLKKTLKFAFSKKVRLQDAPFIVSSVGSNPYGWKITWKEMSARWASIIKKAGTSGSILQYFIRWIPKTSLEENAAIVERFFKDNPTSGVEKAVAQSVEAIRANAAWLERDGVSIGEWLRDRD